MPGDIRSEKGALEASNLIGSKSSPVTIANGETVYQTLPGKDIRVYGEISLYLGVTALATTTSYVYGYILGSLDNQNFDRPDVVNSYHYVRLNPVENTYVQSSDFVSVQSLPYFRAAITNNSGASITAWLGYTAAYI